MALSIKPLPLKNMLYPCHFRRQGDEWTYSHADKCCVLEVVNYGRDMMLIWLRTVRSVGYQNAQVLCDCDGRDDLKGYIYHAQCSISADLRGLTLVGFIGLFQVTDLFGGLLLMAVDAQRTR